MQHALRCFYAIIFNRESGIPVLTEERRLPLSIDNVLLTGFISALQQFSAQYFNMKIKSIMFEKLDDSILSTLEIKMTFFYDNYHTFVLIAPSTTKQYLIDAKIRELRRKLPSKTKKLHSFASQMKIKHNT